MSRIQKNDIVQSFKREENQEGLQYLYQVIDIANHSETMEAMVVYKALYPPCETWVRPYEMFMSEVEREKYPDSKQKYRFEKVDLSDLRKLVYPNKSEYNFEDFLSIIEILRSKEGCPWDRKQSFESMKKCLVDECQEVIEAVDNQDMENLCEELGDVLLQVVMNSQIAKESQIFAIEDVINGVSKKLVRRHPHVFGEDKAADSEEEALEKWKAMKRMEKHKE